MRLVPSLALLLLSACITPGPSPRPDRWRETAARAPLLLDLYAVNYGECDSGCTPPKRFTLLYEGGASGVLRISGKRETLRPIPAAVIASVIEVLDPILMAETSDASPCIHCRHWLVTARIVGLTKTFDDARDYEKDDPDWIIKVLALLGERPPPN
jgi:hypothetical protein